LAPYFFIAVGLWIENAEMTRADKNDDDLEVRWMTAVYLPFAVQPL
jgi:hypothetical protein